MLFPTLTFAVFFFGVYLVHLALRTRRRLWQVAMIGASYVFYGWWDWRFCGLLGASTVVNWGIAHRLERAEGARRRLLVAMAVVANLAGLSLFKYYGFFVETISASFGSAVSLPALELALPIGISFFTFQAISYVVDIHRRKLDSRPLLDFALYLSFFPQLVAGPIVRGTELLPQLDRLGQDDRVEISEAALLIARGLFKKMVVATYLATSVVDPVFDAPSLATRTELLLAFYGYAVQIYADFSGYTDIAIGIALLLGFRFPTNFDSPYRARSIQEFWRRWHMTLSRWLRDYLYIPLGGNRGSPAATYRNLMATMVLGGLWHGAAWTFVIWGAVHGLALSVERFAGRWHRPASGRWWSAFRWLVTFHVVCLAWVPFRAETFALAGEFLVGLATAPLTGPFNIAAAVLIVLSLGAQLAPSDLADRLRRIYAGLDPAMQSAAVGVWIFLVSALGPEGVAPFIYFQF
jgi:D-alanyl-lipoteichoic acid acyltransferase DltB (MBOAT superfamily)